MGNTSSRNDHYPVPPAFMPPVYPGYPQFPTATSWNPFKRSQLKKREKALRDYLYTTPMILQYPGAFTGASKFFPLWNYHLMRTTCSHPARTEPGATWYPTGTDSYLHGPHYRQWCPHPNASPHVGPDDGCWCWCRCWCSPCTRSWRCCRCAGHSITDDVDGLSRHLRLLYLSRSPRSR